MYHYNELEPSGVSQRKRDLAIFAATGAAIMLGLPRTPKVVFFTPSSGVGVVANKSFAYQKEIAGQARLQDPNHVFVREELGLVDMMTVCAHEVRHLKSFRDAAETLHTKGFSNWDDEIAEREAHDFESRFQEFAAPVLEAIREKSEAESKQEKARAVAEIRVKAEELRALLAAAWVLPTVERPNLKPVFWLRGFISGGVGL